MRKPIWVASTIGLLALVLTGLVLISAMRGSEQFDCEACMVFHGRRECRTATGATEDEATTTAITAACSAIAFGMTETVSCTTGTRPESIRCRRR